MRVFVKKRVKIIVQFFIEWKKKHFTRGPRTLNAKKVNYNFFVKVTNELSVSNNYGNKMMVGITENNFPL